MFVLIASINHSKIMTQTTSEASSKENSIRITKSDFLGVFSKQVLCLNFRCLEELMECDTKDRLPSLQSSRAPVENENSDASRSEDRLAVYS